MNLENQRKLANEAINLLNEFAEVQDQHRENSFNEITCSEDGAILTIDDVFEGKYEIELKEVSNVISREMDGFGPCGFPFYDCYDELISNLDYDYKNMSKEEYINYAGSLHYIKCRCEEIYERLKEIESEF